VAERPLRQAAVERALAAGWALIGGGALVAAVAAVRQLEDEPLLNAGIGACLNLEGDVPCWTIDDSTMRTVATWLDTHTLPPARAWDENKRVLVRDRLSELLPGHNIAPGDTHISLAAAADLLDIIERLQAPHEHRGEE